jgi:hypothetical protein
MISKEDKMCEEKREELMIEVSKLIETKASEMVAAGMKPEDAFNCTLEALEGALDTWDEEGREVLGVSNDELD